MLFTLLKGFMMIEYPIEKNITIGKTDNGDYVKVKITVNKIVDACKLDTDLNKLTTYHTVSLSGEIGVCQCGQIKDTLLELANTDKLDLIIDHSDFIGLMDIWKLYHLNDMQAGTELQSGMIDKLKVLNPDLFENDHYNGCKTALNVNGLLVDRGYTYGSQWLVQLIPEDVLGTFILLINKYESNTGESKVADYLHKNDIVFIKKTVNNRPDNLTDDYPHHFRCSLKIADHMGIEWYVSYNEGIPGDEECIQMLANDVSYVLQCSDYVELSNDLCMDTEEQGEELKRIYETCTEMKHRLQDFLGGLAELEHFIYEVTN